MTKHFKSLSLTIMSLILAITCAFVYCTNNYYQTKASVESITRNIEVSLNEIDYESFFEQFDSVEFMPDEKLSTLNLVQTIDDELLSEINNVSSTSHSKGEVCYDIEYDRENGKVYLNSTVYLDDDENSIFEQIEGIACWNDKINDVDIAFETDGEVIFLSELNENINNCGWFRRALSFIKKHAVAAIIASVAVVAVVTVCVAAPAFVAAATAAVSTGGGTAAFTSGITAGLVAAGKAVASSALVSSTIAAAATVSSVVLTACAIEGIITLTETYVTDFANSVKKTNREDRYILVVLSALDQPLVTHYKPVTLETAKNWFLLGGQVWTPYSNDAVSLIESCGYVAGDSRMNIGVPERNILPDGLYGNWHYHALEKDTLNKVRLPGDGKDVNVSKAHAVHCFFYYNV